MELKTVQINDELTIARPCIDAANVGYNIEWSQELKVARFARPVRARGDARSTCCAARRSVFGRPFGDVDFGGIAGETIYDMSIGYDLAGIRSERSAASSTA